MVASVSAGVLHQGEASGAVVAGANLVAALRLGAPALPTPHAASGANKSVTVGALKGIAVDSG